MKQLKPMADRVAIYTRVSTLDQAREGYSLDAQRKALTRWAQEREYTIIGYYADEGISGKDITHRPAMQRLLDDVTDNKIDIIVVWALSRFTRSVADLYNMWDLLSAHQCGLVSYTESFDATTITGRAMLGVLGIFAQMEREYTAERVRAAAAERAAQGKRTCNEVLGYDLDGKDTLKINPVEAERVRYIFAKYAEYHNLSAVAELCRLRGYTGKRGRIQTAESIRKILTRPIYAGYNVYLDELYQGTHEPLVSVKEYNHVQDLLQSHGHKRRKYPKLP
ncbi:recombinase family protein [Agathobaculum butyriciproducens]|uniref:recombinase family protein n=1 Tax=Agathobaculum butyriciproducens TaxID=1628085 RepID=UPI003AEF77B1